MDLDHPIFQVIDQENRNYGVFGRVDWTGDFIGHPADFVLWASTVRAISTPTSG
jgi:iron complex outermembrane receptor protein